MLIVLVNSCEQQQQTNKNPWNAKEGTGNSTYGCEKSVVIY